MYVSDIPGHVGSEVRILADDTKIWRALITNFDHTILQEDPKLSKLCEWSRKWLLKFHAGKCKMVHWSSNNPHYQYTMTNVNDTEETMLDESDEKDLGVYLDVQQYETIITVFESRSYSDVCTQIHQK